MTTTSASRRLDIRLTPHDRDILNEGVVSPVVV